jgi:DMSO/TMAO reductase YedYZ molybdopterin-dependent catalytic subunit
MSDDSPDKPELIGAIRDKLIRTKQHWAEQGRLLTGKTDARRANRLPPGQKEVKNWPVLDLGAQPDVKPDRWRLRVSGLVENPLVWTLPEFFGLPQERHPLRDGMEPL